MHVIINIDAPDVDRAERFYAEGLGLKPVRRLFGGKLAEMKLGAQLFHILPKAEGALAFAGGPERGYARHWTPVHLDFVVDDIEAALERALAAVATMERAISAHEWGRIAGLSDPFGHGLCLIEMTKLGYV